MVTISHLTKKALEDKPFIHESLERGLINVVALAEMIRPGIERELGNVKTSAISMAIRREMEQNKHKYREVKLRNKTDLLIKSNLFELSVQKSATLFLKLSKLYDLVNFSTGDTLNIIQGNYENLIISNDRYKDRFIKALKGETIKKVRDGIASLSIQIPNDSVDIPGFYYTITRILAFNNISIIDMVNTENEATLILDDQDIPKAYDLLKKEISISVYKKSS